MIFRVYTEETLVQQTTVDYLREHLGWESVHVYSNEFVGCGEERTASIE